MPFVLSCSCFCAIYRSHMLSREWRCSLSSAKYISVVNNFVPISSLRPRQNGCLFADDPFKRIFLNENIRISTKNSLKLVSKGLFNNIPALVLIMAWRRPGDKPLSEPMLVRSLTHICVTRRQWVKVRLILEIWQWIIPEHGNVWENSLIHKEFFVFNWSKTY